MRSSQRKGRSFSVTFSEQNLGILDNILAPCLNKANITETAQEIYRRMRNGHAERPVSLECQVVSKTLVQDDPPLEDCLESSVLTINTQYFWVLLSPRHSQIDCIFVGSEIEASHDICVPRPKCPEDDDGSTPIHFQSWYHDEMPSMFEEGAIVRWSVPESEGSFSSVHYIKRWPVYTHKQNKALMDILRYSSAAAYLNIPIPKTWLLDEPTTPKNPTTPEPGIGDSMKAIGEGMKAIGEGWSAISNALANKVTETVKREVCLGFERYEHVVTALAAKGVHQEHFVEIVDALIKSAQPRVPDIQDMKDAMVVL
ncbi:hypothetical protein BGW38_009071, partial [Lunasporangiospora selenospora]